MDGIFVNDMSRTGDTSRDPNLPRIYNTPATDCNVLNLEVLEKRVGVRPEFLSQCTCAREARAGLVHLQIGPQLEPRGKIKVSDLYHRFEDEAQTCIGSQGWRIQHGSLDRPAHRPHRFAELGRGNPFSYLPFSLEWMRFPTLTPRQKKNGGRRFSGSDGVDSDRPDLTWATGTGANWLGKLRVCECVYRFWRGAGMARRGNSEARCLWCVLVTMCMCVPWRVLLPVWDCFSSIGSVLYSGLPASVGSAWRYCKILTIYRR